jgi:hypothetical protein
MTENTMPTNGGQKTEPTDPEQAAPQAPEEQVGSIESQLKLGQPGWSIKRTAPGRAPLFRR